MAAPIADEVILTDFAALPLNVNKFFPSVVPPLSLVVKELLTENKQSAYQENNKNRLLEFIKLKNS